MPMQAVGNAWNLEHAMLIEVRRHNKQRNDSKTDKVFTYHHQMIT